MNQHVNLEVRPLKRASVRPGHASRTSMEKLATDCDCPLELVEQLYTREITTLEGEARIQTFIPVVALRRVREALRRAS